MRVSLLILLLIVTPCSAQERLWKSSEVYSAAAADLVRQPGAKTYTRYLSLAGIPPKDRQRWARVLSFHCNQLSTESDITAPAPVGDVLLRVNLLDYGWRTEAWEKLADADPYYHVQTVTKHSEPWGGGVWPGDGKHYPPGSFRVEHKVKKGATAPYVAEGEGATAAKYLIEATQSQVPIVDGWWFLWQTAIQADRVPGYYDFLGVKDKAAFDRLIGFDAKLAKDAKRVELLEAVAVSSVTHQPRRIGAFPAISGWYWQTFDSREAKDEKNPLRILNGGYRFDAQELIGTLPNGNQAFFLADDKGVRQDAAPDFIASDGTAPGTDRRVHAGVSCLRCHLPNSGINPVDGWARNLFTGDLKLQSPDYEKLRELRQKYLRDLEGPMEDSRRVYARAILEATGMKPGELGDAYAEMFAAFDAPVTLERAARDAGMTPEAFQMALKAYLLKTGAIDTVAAAYLSKRRALPVRQYLEAFPLIQYAIRGLQPLP